MKTKFVVEKSPPLKGTVKISGAKNSVLPIIAASLLSSDEVILEDIPSLEDVNVMIELIKNFGALCELDNGKLKIKVDIKDVEAPYELVKKMRASFLVMGPILAKLGHAKISMPGGCAIGARPIDLHLKGFQSLGADITIGHGYVEARAKKLTGKKIYLDFPSVGATENIMMAAVFADGVTVIENAAEEPEIVDLANFLNKMGANIKGAGTDTIRIEGVKELKGAEHTVIPDRIEAGTFMVAAAMTGGNVLIENVIVDHVRSVIAKLTECGVKITEEKGGLRVKGVKNYKAVDIKTLPYPGFPTDMQAQMMAMMTVAKGTSVIIETVFENRFMHVSELKRMGANIKIEGRSAMITGVDHLTGAEVKATDLRAGAALVLAGLIAEGRTEINDIYHVDRGYVKMEEKLRALGAKIYRK
ncbi:UDP-N-acetylglucosamine 1-carboxyvinyltransferase [Caldanaerobacter subterraneus subsp. tengcongensis MB4]|uniref:UDP-N-acetylglucosamine 1-carboxyvinyltransferase 1 n=2 Tax=Caldanaerobacter subterraneus TaxID=911092 RepID=MURA1_CALS4|nr:RecName: Full=UDP-N-acetylglucosamine 1-carboxyvinyltransferase 1; AltName: Full=Enoylpyruvate transferase 1; AltName: Full=UDP-N-acetylglucosamine enolpyruvyl transferase 1; Short=EPT 1 [Caldanaerobacter subterraneus subsp. tengcongensis MB4]AAM23459.1 UDP-N-acetylglucosamine enolpyruvyl transferase [Caldanaerobacter subterraneus subsp. tengcongensis MB4]MCS3917062.1 UDP-N-acetylglucosamine 1-carboxyvinyltransferase [Caldanaerobacter subterraneus subsp. tengcongensis MB4]